MQDIDDWVFEQFGADLADRTQARLRETFDLLSQFPSLGRSRPYIKARSVLFFALKP